MQVFHRNVRSSGAVKVFRPTKSAAAITPRPATAITAPPHAAPAVPKNSTFITQTPFPRPPTKPKPKPKSRPASAVPSTARPAAFDDEDLEAVTVPATARPASAAAAATATAATRSGSGTFRFSTLKDDIKRALAAGSETDRAASVQSNQSIPSRSVSAWDNVASIIVKSTIDSAPTNPSQTNARCRARAQSARVRSSSAAPIDHTGVGVDAAHRSIPHSRAPSPPPEVEEPYPPYPPSARAASAQAVQYSSTVSSIAAGPVKQKRPASGRNSIRRAWVGPNTARDQYRPPTAPEGLLGPSATARPGSTSGGSDLHFIYDNTFTVRKAHDRAVNDARLDELSARLNLERTNRERDLAVALALQQQETERLIASRTTPRPADPPPPLQPMPRVVDSEETKQPSDETETDPPTDEVWDGGDRGSDESGGSGDEAAVDENYLPGDAFDDGITAPPQPLVPPLVIPLPPPSTQDQTSTADEKAVRPQSTPPGLISVRRANQPPPPTAANGFAVSAHARILSDDTTDVLNAVLGSPPAPKPAMSGGTGRGGQPTPTVGSVPHQLTKMTTLTHHPQESVMDPATGHRIPIVAKIDLSQPDKPWLKDGLKTSYISHRREGWGANQPVLFQHLCAYDYYQSQSAHSSRATPHLVNHNLLSHFPAPPRYSLDTRRLRVEAVHRDKREREEKARNEKLKQTHQRIYPDWLWNRRDFTKQRELSATDYCLQVLDSFPDERTPIHLRKLKEWILRPPPPPPAPITSESTAVVPAPPTEPAGPPPPQALVRRGSISLTQPSFMRQILKNKPNPAPTREQSLTRRQLMKAHDQSRRASQLAAKHRKERARELKAHGAMKHHQKFVSGKSKLTGAGESSESDEFDDDEQPKPPRPPQPSARIEYLNNLPRDFLQSLLRVLKYDGRALRCSPPLSLSDD